MRLLVLGAMAVVAPAAQSLLPARPGVILFVEGHVTVDGQTAVVWPARQPEMSGNGELRTQKGRAELLLNPCTVLHLGEHSALRMVENSLTKARVELLAGSAVVEDDSGNHRRGVVEMMAGGNMVRIARDGIYRFDSDPARVRVFEGVLSTPALTAGHGLTFGGAPLKFDRKQWDDLQTWNDLRVRHLMDDSGIGPQLDRARMCVP